MTFQTKFLNFGEVRSSRLPKCCVPECNDRKSKRHRFPKRFPDSFQTWLERIKPHNYEKLSSSEIYKKFFVCEAHFSQEDIVPGYRGLKVTAVPSLNIPGFSEPDDATTLSDTLSTVSEPTFSKSFPTKKGLAESVEVQELSSQLSRFSVPDIREELPSSTSCDTTLVVKSEISRYSPASGSPKTAVYKRGSRRNLLGQVNVSRAAELTPKAQKFYRTLKKWSVDMANKQRKIISYQERLANAEKVVKSQNYEQLLRCVNNPTYNFIMCQVRNQNLRARARRYTLEEKILALSLYKSSGKGYKFLHKIFSLPSPKTLKFLLQEIPMEAGINKHILQSLKSHVEKMKDEREKVCILVFDEMEISSSLKYERKKDCIIGFQDTGTQKDPSFANRANVFMLKGIFRHWKQAIVFTFNDGPNKTISLKNMIKEIIKECFEIGLEIVATVCDQGVTNQAAINMLLKETKEVFLKKNEINRNFGFVVDDREVIPLYDIPHLFKGIRNNLLTKNLHFKLKGMEKIAKWAHVMQFYKLDSSEPTFRLCYKLTDEHVIPGKIKKMKVKNCTQVFSHTVGSLMKRISNWDIKDNFHLSPECADTADLILFLDNLFDSFNVTRYSKVQGAKPLKCPVTKKSGHLEFWQEALKIVNGMKFFSLQKNCFVSVPSLTNLKFTIEGFSRLTKVLLEKKNFKFVLTGLLNQDALENFFSYIRSHFIRNTNPDPSQFIDSFKSLVVNNYMASHSAGSNCQSDVDNTGLDNLREFLTGKLISGVSSFQPDIPKVEIPKEIVLLQRTKIGRCTIKYMSGAIIRILKKTIKCECCLKNLIVRHGKSADDDFIEARKYEKGNLILPGDFFNFLVTNSLNYLFYCIPRICTKSNISTTLQTILKSRLMFKIINCPNPEHNLGDKLCSLLTRCALFWWTKSVNQILKGKSSKFSTFLSLCKHNNLIDPIKLKALRTWEKKKKYHKK